MGHARYAPCPQSEYLYTPNLRKINTDISRRKGVTYDQVRHIMIMIKTSRSTTARNGSVGGERNDAERMGAD